MRLDRGRRRSPSRRCRLPPSPSGVFTALCLCRANDLFADDGPGGLELGRAAIVSGCPYRHPTSTVYSPALYFLPTTAALAIPALSPFVLHLYHFLYTASTSLITCTTNTFLDPWLHSTNTYTSSSPLSFTATANLLCAVHPTHAVAARKCLSRTWVSLSRIFLLRHHSTYLHYNLWDTTSLATKATRSASELLTPTSSFARQQEGITSPNDLVKNRS